MGDLISVIVPIYNVAPYLDKCIRSICNQSYKALEIILVDDGSTDESGRICDEFAKRDNRILVIHQQNGKITRARKAGLKVAAGKYVTFVDGDDWIESDMYEVLYRDAVRENVPIVLSGLYRDNDEGTYTVWPPTKCGYGYFDGERLEILKEHIRSWFNWATFNKLVLREVVEEELKKIDDDLYGIEDDAFSAGCIARVERLYVEEKVFYHGYDRLDSATHTRHKDYYLMMHRALPYYENMMSCGNSNMRKDLQRGFINSLMHGINEVFPELLFPQYLFLNKENIPDNSKVVIYGAGNVGECYYQQIRNTGMFDILLLVDKKIRNSRRLNLEVHNPNEIKEIEYDYIIVAVLEESVAIQIKNNLLSIGVDEDKIIWEKPCLVLEMLGL